MGRKQIRKGWAASYVYDVPFKRLRSYRRAESAASQEHRGVWQLCDGDFHDPL
jgi:endonuclease YncB( thermonuclease family)